jgi:hypothetical protein
VQLKTVKGKKCRVLLNNSKGKKVQSAAK